MPFISSQMPTFSSPKFTSRSLDAATLRASLSDVGCAARLSSEAGLLVQKLKGAVAIFVVLLFMPPMSESPASRGSDTPR